jgi:hypothetical protein
VDNDSPRTCVDPSARFVCAVHRPSYEVANCRKTSSLSTIGYDRERAIDNRDNFPHGDIVVEGSDWVYEIPNPFPFWGATYILQASADRLSMRPGRFRFRPEESDREAGPILQDLLQGSLTGLDGKRFGLEDLPRTVLLALAQTSRDPALLEALAEFACDFENGSGGGPLAFRYGQDDKGRLRPAVRDEDLFEVLGNNPALPDSLKQAMVLVPGVQGDSPIVGEYGASGSTHVWEYLRRNSYIPWGHYASNMAHDCVRYRVRDLLAEDMRGLRHLYYQRVFVQMAQGLGVPWRLEEGKKGGTGGRLSLGVPELEDLRTSILEGLSRRRDRVAALPYSATLWGWNYGFDFSPSGYRLHASHQQIHQQFALVPPAAESAGGKEARLPTYAVGDQVAHFCAFYKRAFGRSFFDAYIGAIRSNMRLDGREDLPSDLIIHEDRGVMAFVPKAQRSQGEVQIMTTGPVGNVIEAGSDVRDSLDRCIHLVIRTLDRLGAEMVTGYELSKRFDNPDPDQRLLYCFLPRHPQSPGAFSERQERWITGHYPEDYAEAFRMAMRSLEAH